MKGQNGKTGGRQFFIHWGKGFITLLSLILVSCPSPIGYFPDPSDALASLETSETAPLEVVEPPLLYHRSLGGSEPYQLVGADTAYFATDREFILRSATPGATIYYTTDGTFPSPSGGSGSAFDESTPLILSQDQAQLELRAIAVKALLLPSDVTGTVVGLDYLRVSTPLFSLPEGSYDTIQTVTLSTTTSGAVIYYTVSTGSAGVADPPDPVPGDPDVPVYDGPITISFEGTTKIKAIAVKDGMADSSIPMATYVYALPRWDAVSWDGFNWQ